MRSNPRSQSSGQTLPLFAILLPGMLALMALGLDGAQLFLERREAQSAADLAALAGVRSLPDTPLTAIADAKAVGTAHGFEDAQVVVVTPYDSDASQIEVQVNSSVDTFFMSILSVFGGGEFGTMDVSARAVAESTTTGGGGGGFAIFALETGCGSEKTVDISGSDDLFIGKVHSNSDVYLSGQNIDVDGNTTSVCGTGPLPIDATNDLDPDPTITTAQPDPINLTRDDFTCTYTAPNDGAWDLTNNGPWWVGFSSASKTLKAGTYCAKGSDGFISLGDQNIVIEDVESGAGGVTFIAQSQIEVSGSDFNLHPHEHNVLFFSEGTSDVAIKANGSQGLWAGIMYAPNGTAEFSGQGNGQNNEWFTGGIVAQRVKLNGSNANINGTIGPDTGGDQVIALKE